MSQNRRTLLTIAAEMRAVGHSWEAVAQRVHRKPRTCQKWPSRFRGEWDLLYCEIQQRRFHETSEEAHTLLKQLMRDDDKKLRVQAIQLWLKSGAAAYGMEGNMRWPNQSPAGPTAEDERWAAMRADEEYTRRRMNTHRELKGLPPLTDEEFFEEYVKELDAVNAACCLGRKDETPAPSGTGVHPLAVGVLLLIGLFWSGPAERRESASAQSEAVARKNEAPRCMAFDEGLDFPHTPHGCQPLPLSEGPPMFDRRSFITHSAAVTAAMAALRGGPLFAEEPKPVNKPVGANDTLRVAIIGTGGRGGSHVSAFNGNYGCQIVTLCDADSSHVTSHMKAVAKKSGQQPKFEVDIRKVLEDKSIDIVSIATPNHWHALGAIWAMQAGKHVYVEKPASHNVLEGRWMIETARKHKRICQVGTQSRSSKGMQEAMAYLHEGKIGKIKQAYGTCYKSRKSIGKVEGEQKIPATVDYDLWCGPAAKLPLMRKNLHYDWHWTWEYGNGDLGNQGVHEMDKARWGLNKKELPKSVVSAGGRFGYVDDGETANTQICIFDYGDTELVFEVRGLPSDSPYPGNMGGKPGSNFVGNVWYGDKGTVVCPSYSGGVALAPDLSVIQKFEGGGDHFENFVKAVRSGKHEDLNCDISEGHPSAALCHLANISLRQGKTTMLGELKDIAGTKEANEILKKMLTHLEDNKVDLSKTPAFYGALLAIDAKKETFTGNNDKAKAMLTREYRKGFQPFAEA